MDNRGDGGDDDLLAQGAPTACSTVNQRGGERPSRGCRDASIPHSWDASIPRGLLSLGGAGPRSGKVENSDAMKCCVEGTNDSVLRFSPP